MSVMLDMVPVSEANARSCIDAKKSGELIEFCDKRGKVHKNVRVLDIEFLFGHVREASGWFARLELREADSIADVMGDMRAGV